jgi:hypothetical protein
VPLLATQISTLRGVSVITPVLVRGGGGLASGVRLAVGACF